jgi:hypothetical protein
MVAARNLYLAFRLMVLINQCSYVSSDNFQYLTFLSTSFCGMLFRRHTIILRQRNKDAKTKYFYLFFLWHAVQNICMNAIIIVYQLNINIFLSFLIVLFYLAVSRGFYL